MSLTTFTRIWAMPSADTFDIAPIGQLVKRYLKASKVSVDPFARNKRWATYTNDLNPETAAEWHTKADVFLRYLRMKKVCVDLVIFDPPYSLRQTKECYEGFGFDFTQRDSQEVGRWTPNEIISTTFWKLAALLYRAAGIVRAWEKIGLWN